MIKELSTIKQEMRKLALSYGPPGIEEQSEFSICCIFQALFPVEGQNT